MKEPTRSSVIGHKEDIKAESFRGSTNDRQASPANTDTDDLQTEQDDNPRSPKRRRIGSESQNGPENIIRRHASLSPGTSAIAPSLPRAEDEPRQTDQVFLSHQTASVINQQPSIRTRIDSLPMLENLSLQILSILAKLAQSDGLNSVRDPQTSAGQEYATARSLFEPTRRLYTTGEAFMSPKKLNLTQPQQAEILRKANMAIFMSSIFTGEVGLRDMNRNFIEVFVPEGGRLLKAQGSIWLELKTQAFITARRTFAAAPEVVMADMFPPDIESQLLAKRPGGKSLAPSEQDFLNRLSSRRDILLSEIKINTLDDLPSRYRWEDFSREVSTYLSRNYEGTGLRPSKESNDSKSAVVPPVKLDRGQMEGRFSIHAAPGPVTPSQPVTTPTATMMFQPASSDFSMRDDFVAQAARAAEIAMQGPSEVNFEAQPKPLPPTQPKVMQQEKTSAPPQPHPNFQYYDPVANTSRSHGPYPDEAEIPHSSQTAPTQVLYERARQAASAKMNASSRKANTPSQRRPWSAEEENALMAGLDRVRGPHWSQILAMFGPGGTINESLKDRNQVQLKDKARNLKLFFLKSGIEVPYYLRYVTGDLKSRAPSQASKQEARERERQQAGEVNAHYDGIQGIMALASGDPFSQPQAQMPMLEPLFRLPQVSTSPTGGQQAQPQFSGTTDMSDVEAMIARAAAQVSQSLDAPGWH